MHTNQVLQYLAIESVILFHTVDELQIAACGVIKPTTLCDESIRVGTSLLSTTHVRAYMALVNGEASGVQLLPSDGEEEPHSPLEMPTLVGEPHNTSNQTLGILWLMSCDSSWRSSKRRLHSES